MTHANDQLRSNLVLAHDGRKSRTDDTTPLYLITAH